MARQVQILLAVLGAGVLFLLGPSQNKAVVLIKEGNFNSSVLTIQRGSTVIWINASDKPVWPAADPHPSHTGYPGTKGCIGSGLDACRPLKKGERYSFEFHQTGQWSIHDHLHPATGQEVKVVDKLPGQAEKVSAALRGYWFKVRLRIPSPSDFSRLPQEEQKRVLGRLAKTDPAGSWEYLKQAFLKDGQATSDQHDLAHYLGSQLYLSHGLKSLSYCDGTFSYGCIHGIAEESLQTGQDSVAKVVSACSDASGGVYDAKASNCVHGIGHGVASTQLYELKPALELCNPLDGRFKHDCYNGVFMEYALGAPNVPVSVDKPWGLCKEVGEDSAWECGWYTLDMIHYRLQVTSLEERLAICQEAPYEKARNACHGSLGTWYAMAKTQPSQIIENCRRATAANGKEFCMLEAASALAFSRAPNWKQDSYLICSAIPGSKGEECRERTQTLDG
jgi:plastocyanin